MIPGNNEDLYEIKMDIKTGKPANGKYEYTDNGLYYEDTYDHGILSKSCSKQYGTTEINIYKVGKYNSSMLEHKTENKDIKVYAKYDNYVEDNLVKSREINYDFNMWNPNLKDFYIAQHREAEYMVTGFIQRSIEKSKVVNIDNQYLPKKYFKETVMGKTDYHICQNYLNKDEKSLIIVELYNNYYDINSNFLTYYDCSDIETVMYYDDKTVMLKVTKIKENVYQITYYNILGNQELNKFLTLQDALTLVKEIVDNCYKDYSLDYKKVYNYVNKAEEICADRAPYSWHI